MSTEEIYRALRQAIIKKECEKITQYGASLMSKVHPYSPLGETVRDAVDLAFFALEHPHFASQLKPLFDDVLLRLTI